MHADLRRFTVADRYFSSLPRHVPEPAVRARGHSLGHKSHPPQLDVGAHG
jgi:hypothetical protein